MSSRGCEHAGDGIRVALPRRELGAELCSAPRGELVELCFAVVLRETPLALDPPLSLETMQGRVERALLDEKGAIAPFADGARDGVPVRWAPGQRLENQEIECPLKKVERAHPVSPKRLMERRYPRVP